MAKEFSDLPEEMMVEVFKHLDGTAVNQAALVCKEWNRVISTTPTIMKKFKLIVTSYHLRPPLWERSRQLMTLERNFTRAYIETDEFSGDRLMEVAERFGNRLRDFDFAYKQVCSSVAWNPLTTLKVLQNTPELEKLAMHFRDKILRPDFEVGSVTLRKLKKLEDTGNCDIYPLIKAPQLVELKNRRQESGYHRQLQYQNFGKFLKSSAKLQKLETYLGIFEQLEPGFPFRLKELVGSRSFHLTDKIEKFLLTQAATVEVLEVECEDSKCHELVLTNFTRLRTLKANLEKLEPSQKFYNNLKPMPLLTELWSLNGFSCETATRAVLGNCPGLQKLECKEDRNLPSHLGFIAEFNKNLKVLGVHHIGETDAKFHFLNVLIVTTVEDTSRLIDFLKSNESIETLNIQWLHNLEMKDIGSLITETTLKHLKMHGHKPQVEAVHNEFKSKFGSWTTLKLNLSWRSESVEVEINRAARPKGTKRKNPCSDEGTKQRKQSCSIQ